MVTSTTPASNVDSWVVACGAGKEKIWIGVSRDCRLLLLLVVRLWWGERIIGRIDSENRADRRLADSSPPDYWPTPVSRLFAGSSAPA
ncbi:MAG: hypothetical protein J07HR59_01328 [Halorubrum sp. J07HR59]|nr:MAG: hypothetical protein J07HR59_01328 [Halorubrum sp. J07HR59]